MRNNYGRVWGNTLDYVRKYVFRGCWMRSPFRTELISRATSWKGRESQRPSLAPAFRFIDAIARRRTWSHVRGARDRLTADRPTDRAPRRRIVCRGARGGVGAKTRRGRGLYLVSITLTGVEGGDDAAGVGKALERSLLERYAHVCARGRFAAGN